MDIQKNEALVAEIEQFKKEALKMHIVQVLADSYTNTNLFDYNIDSDSSVIWYKAQARQLWDFWQTTKAQANQKLNLLLCDEHLKKCESPTGVFNSQYPDEEPCLICLHKARAVPEVITIGNELQSWVAVNSFSADDGEGILPVVDANAIAAKIEELTGANQ